MNINKTLTLLAVGMVATFGIVTSVSADWIIPVGATASSEQDANSAATNTINGSGLSLESSNGLHAAGSNLSWSFKQSNGIQTQNEFITFDLGAFYDLTGTYIWQFTRNAFANEVNRGVSQFDILVSTNGIDFTEVLSNATLVKAIDANANGIPDGNETNQFKAFSALGVRYVQFGIDSTFEGSTSDFQGGFGEVRFEGIAAIPEPSSLVLVGLGLLGILIARQRRPRSIV